MAKKRRSNKPRAKQSPPTAAATPATPAPAASASATATPAPAAATPAPKQAATPTPKQAAAPAPKPSATVTPLPARAPAFWFGFEVAWAKLAVARVVVFTLLALDAFLQLSHAPRYGAGNFNVGQLPFFDAIGPGRVSFGVAQLALAYMFVLVAFGVATRVLVPVCAAIYAWLYFGSQLDSYQHHYLVAIVLVIASFVPWQRAADAEPRTPVRSWAVRLLLVQLAIMYLWAAISKMNHAWVDGTTLSMQMTGTVGAVIAKTIGFKVASVLVIAVELALAAMVWARPAWKIAAPLGIAFHLGIIFTGLEIGLFAFLMLGIYALVVPDVVWVAVTGGFERLARSLAKPSWIAFGLGLAASIALAWLVRLEDAFVVGVATCIVPLGVAVYGALRGRAPAAAVGIAHVIAIALWLLLDRTTDITKDYYRFWGGSQRRLGSPEAAEYAYRRLTEVAPDEEPGHYQLGRLLIKRGATEEGLRELHEAQRLEPSLARAFVEEARLLVKQGKAAEAIEKAKQATYAEPSHAGARTLLDSLTGAKPAPTLPDDDAE